MNLLKPLVDVATEVGGKFIADKTKLAEFQTRLQAELLSAVVSNDQVRSSVVLGEVQGESWLQRNWRPVLMLSVVAIVVNNHLLAPYVQLMFGVEIVIDLPERMWDLMVLGVGGYIGGRSVEKVVSVWAGAKKGGAG